MPTSDGSLRDELLDTHTWDELKTLYKDIHFKTPEFERVEEYGVTTHGLDARLAHLETFWRYHVAPATHRPVHTHLDADVSDVTTRIAQCSYEVYANVVDALDELGVAPKPPRYRSCLNVLRCMGDACQLFDDLTDVIGQRDRRRDVRTDNLARRLNTSILLFPNWGTPQWAAARMEIADYRHMLVHHGRPWLFFDGKEFESEPIVVKAEYCRVRPGDPNADFLTWRQQQDLFRKERSKFITLRQACADTCNDGIDWLNRAYGELVSTIDRVLQERARFDEYLKLWGCDVDG